MMDSLAPEKTLRKLRIIWAVLLVDMVAVSVIAFVMMMDKAAPSLAGAQGGAIGKRQAFLYIAMLGGTGLAYFTRMQFYKRYWQADRVAPRGYFTGNLILFVFINVIAMCSAFFYMTGDKIITMIFPALVMTLLMAVNFPTGSAMVAYRRPLE